ncbi:unnamed protein product, partial [Didymodactylos carnosus]
LKRLGLQESKYILLRLKENDQISNESDEMNDSDGMMELGLIQTEGNYYELGLTNLIHLRYLLLKKPELFPFYSHSLLNTDFDPKTFLPSQQLLEKLEQIRSSEQKDLI